jgi:epoxyqueuosine reductase
MDFQELSNNIRQWGLTLGFDQVAITDTDLTAAEQHLFSWLDKGYHGDMHYMEKHGHKRSRPAELVENTVRIISVRMDYWPETDDEIESLLENNGQAYVSRYALGRDYHKVLRKRLQQLANQIEQAIKEYNLGEFDYRVFVDSAPVLEKALAEKAGLGWIGKHTNLINDKSGSWFFLGELYTNLPLTIDTPATEHCGSCTACIDCCPTRAIVAPYELDARLCISYLTIEYDGSIPVDLRPLIGNRIYGCDDCQAVCPWNKFMQTTREPDFLPRHNLDKASLLELLDWTLTDFEQRLEGSAIRRIGYEQWMRNIVVACGNANYDKKLINVLRNKREQATPLVREHIDWALQQLSARL